MVLINKAEEFANFDFKGLSNLLNTISPIEFGALGSIIAIIISIPLDSYELNAIGNFLELVGQLMLTVQAKINHQSQNQNVSQTDFNNYQKEINQKLDYLLNLIKNRN